MPVVENAQATDEVQNSVTYGEMPDLHKTIPVRGKVEIDIAETSQWIIERKPAEGHHCTFGRACCFYRIKDVRGAPGTADSDDKIAEAGVQLDLLGKNPIIAEVIAKTSEHRAVIERERADIAILRIVGRHMTSNRGTAAIADENKLVARSVGRPSLSHDPINSIGHFKPRTGGRSHGRFGEDCSQRPKIAVDFVAIDVEIEF